MKKVIQFLGCALGGVMIGLFADRLDTAFGALMFTLGIVTCISLPILGYRNRK